MTRSSCRIVLPLLCLAFTAHGQFGLSWSNNLLTVSGPSLSGGKLEIWYLEAFCRTGSTKRDWNQTKIPHHTELLTASPHQLRFRTTVKPDVEVLHDVEASADEISFTYDFHNFGTNTSEIEWFQPACIRVERFTGCVQSNYTDRSFIFTSNGLTPLSRTRRTEEAVYRGGQVYIPAGINLADVNPRPLCLDKPVNGLIGCFSADNKQILATASSRTHELFEGVYVCLHSDPNIHGLAPRETRRIRSKIYLLPNDPAELLRRYDHDFGGRPQF